MGIGDPHCGISFKGLAWNLTRVITVVILKEGCNIHKNVRIEEIEELPKSVEIDGKTYKVDLDGIMKVKKGLLKTLWHYLFRVYTHHMIIFREGEKKPVTYEKPAITPLTLKNVKRSTILGRAMMEMFRAGFMGIGKIFFILFILISIGAIVAYMQGWIG